MGQRGQGGHGGAGRETSVNILSRLPLAWAFGWVGGPYLNPQGLLASSSKTFPVGAPPGPPAGRGCLLGVSFPRTRAYPSYCHCEGPRGVPPPLSVSPSSPALDQPRCCPRPLPAHRGLWLALLRGRSFGGRALVGHLGMGAGGFRCG